MGKAIISEFKCDQCGVEKSILGAIGLPDEWECVTITPRLSNYLCSKECLGKLLMNNGVEILNTLDIEINQNYRLSFTPRDRRIAALVKAARNSFDGPIPGYDETDLGEALKMFHGQFMDKE